jgi:hypothetical protein
MVETVGINQPGEAERPIIDVIMDDVEVVGVFIDVREHWELEERSEVLLARQAQRLRTGRMQFGAGHRIASGEQGHIVTAAHKLLSDVRDDALGAAIKLRRYAFVQGRNLGDAHTRHRGIVKMVSL